jgi:hypothetical protein
MRRQLVGALFLSSVLAVAACGPGRAAAGSGASPDVIGNWELQELPDYNALEAIRRLRPNWLRTGTRPAIAAGGGSGYPRVHLNGVPLQDIRQLEDIRADEIREMRFVSGPDASTRWGTGYVNGVILVTTER